MSIANLLSTSTTRVQLNGEPGNVIGHHRGFRQGDHLSPMLFILVMDVLTALFDKADALGLLAPVAPRPIGHRMYIYVDNVVLFTTPKTEDLLLIKQVLHCFGEASGLKANMVKSTALPICCHDAQVQRLHEEIECEIAPFPTKYLGQPFSLTRLKAVNLQYILGKLADRLPTWKAALLHKSGRLILVKVVLTAIPLHFLVALDVH